MKTVGILISAFIIFLIACTKNNSIIRSSKSEKITTANLSDTWILKQISGGFAGQTTAPTQTTTITFQSPENFTTSYDNQPGDNGTFTITKAGEPNYYNTDTLLTLTSTNNNQTLIYGIHLKTDSLFLSEGCCDRFDYIYVRQQ